MATATGNYVMDNSTLANFKNWAQAISSAFSTFGWVQTADAGQVVWSSIASVPASTYVYEIWKANDSLASALPIFVKMEYGFSATIPRLRVTVGTSSNGAGTITGIVVQGAPWQLSNIDTNFGAVTYPCFFSGSAGEFRMYMWQTIGASRLAIFLIIERSVDSTGTKTADYFTVLAANHNSQSAPFYQQTILPTMAGPRDFGGITVTLTSNAGTGSFNGTVAAFPVFPVFGKVGNAMLGVMTCCYVDVADGAIVTVTSMYGSTHTYVSMSATGSTGWFPNYWGIRTTNGLAIAGLMRYE